jgi:hypothetical protein
VLVFASLTFVTDGIIFDKLGILFIAVSAHSVAIFSHFFAISVPVSTAFFTIFHHGAVKGTTSNAFIHISA